MAARNIRIVPKFTRANVVDFGVIYPDGSTYLIARVVYPQDKQLNDNVEANKQIVEVLKEVSALGFKRITCTKCMGYFFV